MTQAYYYLAIVKQDKVKHDDGTETVTISPDVPEGISWVGNTDGKHYIIKTDQEIPPGADRKRLMPIQDVANEAIKMALNVDDIMDVWAIGGVR